MSLGRAVVGLALAALLTTAAHAASLRTLHVDALSMRADRAKVTIGEVFHLAIHIRVRENVAALDELVVPDVGTMKLEGDERHATSSPGGTDVVETLTLEPTAAGAFTFKGAYLDAVDARTHKPSRFSANPVRVVVVDKTASLETQPYWQVARFMLGIMLPGMVLLAAAALVVTVVRSRRRRVQPVPPVVQTVTAPARPPRLPRDDVADALRAYRTAPGMSSLARLRGALFVAAGANAGATLRDALAATPDQALRAALAAAERTAFGPERERDSSSVDLIAATDGWLSGDSVRAAR